MHIFEYIEISVATVASLPELESEPKILNSIHRFVGGESQKSEDVDSTRASNPFQK